MKAPSEILAVWNKFNDFPMETLTKAWYYRKSGIKKQREVSLMREHYEQYGITGNCFDLAIWLLDEFEKVGIKAYPVGHDFLTKGAHAGVIAISEKGERYLCDLGDQWLQPILIDCENNDFTTDQLSGFFPAADIQIEKTEHGVLVNYYRPNGKIAKQAYNITPIERCEFLHAAEYSQNIIKTYPLLECRIPFKAEIAHWEFRNFESFLSTTQGKIYDEPLVTIDEWADRISSKTGYDISFVIEALSIYK